MLKLVSRYYANMNNLINSESRLTKGKKQVIKGLDEGKFTKILIAADNELHFKSEIIKKCESKGTEYIVCSSKEELGKLCNIDVPCGVIGIEKQI